MAEKNKYKKAYCEMMIKFFDIQHTVEKCEITSDKNGEKVKTVEKPNPLPTFEKFAVKIGVTLKTLENWSKNHKEFNVAFEQCKALQKDMLNDLAMRGFYNSTYTIFVAKNITDMKDKQEVVNNDFSEIRAAYLEAMQSFKQDK